MRNVNAIDITTEGFWRHRIKLNYSKLDFIETFLLTIPEQTDVSKLRTMMHLEHILKMKFLGTVV